MAKVNPNFKNLSQNYLFSEIAKRLEAFTDSHPGVEILKLGVGNTTEPIVPAVVAGLREGVEKLSSIETYTGYGNEQGDVRLRAAIADQYRKRGLEMDLLDVFISDGAKADCANITSIFFEKTVIALNDPAYPVYVDSATLSGKQVVYMECVEEHGFSPTPPQQKVDLIFLCTPNNPTGVVATREELKTFVDYALKNKAVIIFDAAYSEYIRDEHLPKSIYEIEGAKKCAIEIQSFSKSAGFTGVRLGWTVVPRELTVEDSSKGELNQCWNRRQTTMFNGASNIAQEGGLAILSPEGQKQTKAQVDYYMENAKIIKVGMEKLGFKVLGGEHAPYVWLKCPEGLSSWEFFDELLNKTHVVGTPGSGFGKNGEGYMRLSAFGHREDIEKAVRSIQENFGNIRR